MIEYSGVEMVEELTLVRTTDLSDEQIKDNQRVKDVENLKYIERKRKEGVIDDETAKYLSSHYFDTMKKYEKFVLKMVNAIGTKKFKAIKPFSLETGKAVETEKAYGLKDITPNNPMVIIFTDDNGNDINLYLPGMKSIERAVEKVEIGGKYHQQYKADLEAGKSNPKKPYQRLSDINRCLVTAHFKGQLFDLSNQLMENTTDLVDCEVENRFSDNLSDQKHRESLIKDPKNRRELKVRYTTETDSYEVQYNLNGNKEKETHQMYKVVRAIKEKDPKLLMPANKIRVRINNASIVRCNTDFLEEYNERTIKHALAMKSDFEFKSMIGSGEKKLSKDEEKKICDFINVNMEARRSDVFDPKRHLPKEFEEYEGLSNTVKSMYLYNNTEAVYGKGKSNKIAKEKELGKSGTIPEASMKNLLRYKQQLEGKSA